MRAQLQSQQEVIERAKVALEASQQQERELQQARDQLLVRQREHDEAQRALNLEQQQQRQHHVRNGQGPIQQVMQNEQQNVRSQNYDICSVINALGFSQLEYKLPKFSDGNEYHPLEFLENLEKFFRVKNIADDRKMVSVEIALEENARVWFNLQNNINTYESFKITLQARFFFDTNTG